MKNETTEVMIGFDVTRTIERITIDDDDKIGTIYEILL